MKTKEKVVLTTKTWLPVFDGFYGTWLGDKLEIEEQDFDDINERRQENGLDPIEIEYDDLKIDYAGAKKELTRKIFVSVSKELEREGLINGSEFEKLVSPREYNFTNDSINCTLKFSKANVDKIQEYLKNNLVAWERYLSDHFTSRSGFMSFHDNYADSDHWNNLNEVLAHDYRCGAVLDFILKNEGFTTESIYEEVCEFYMSEYITNYQELVSK